MEVRGKMGFLFFAINWYKGEMVLTICELQKFYFYSSIMGCVTIQGAPQKSTAPLNFACGGMLSMHNPKAVPADVSAEKYSQLLSAQVGEKRFLKHEPSSSKPFNPNAQKTLRVRIKMGSNNKAQKNAAIYSGLGLISPSSSMGNSPETLENPPSTTIQVRFFLCFRKVIFPLLQRYVIWLCAWFPAWNRV